MIDIFAKLNKNTKFVFDTDTFILIDNKSPKVVDNV